jgi:3-methyladenine DNA glycosylase AlkD
VPDADARIPELQARLAARAEPSVREWWERYLKGTAAFRGVRMAAIREEVVRWAAEGAPVPETAYALIAEPFSEDKIAGILLLREHLLARLGPADMPAFAALFDRRHLADWGTVDWFCVKVLAALVERDGVDVAGPLAAWARAPGLWRRRAAAVAFAPLAPRGAAVFPELPDLALAACAALVRDSERFAQTGAGWTLRELSKAEPERVRAFVAAHEDRLSREARRMALAKLEGRGRR